MEEKKQEEKKLDWNDFMSDRKKDNIFGSDIDVDVPDSLDDLKKEMEESKKKEEVEQKGHGMFGNTGTIPKSGTEPKEPSQDELNGLNFEMLANMMQGGEGSNPFMFPELTQENLEKFKFLNDLTMKLFSGQATPADIDEAKKVVGEKEVEDLLALAKEMPEEEKKAAVEAQNVYNSMSKTLQESLKEQGIDAENPNVDQDALIKGMAGMFKKLAAEQDSNPSLKEFMNLIGKTMYNKDLLYPLFLRLKDELPKWLEKNKSKVSKEDYDRHTAQYEIAKELCELFDKEEKDVVKITELATKLPEYGALPEEFVVDEAKLAEIMQGVPGMAEMCGMMSGMGGMPGMPGMPGTLGMPGTVGGSLPGELKAPSEPSI